MLFSCYLLALFCCAEPSREDFLVGHDFLLDHSPMAQDPYQEGGLDGGGGGWQVQ